MVRIFEPGVAIENRRLGQVGEELGFIEEGAKASKLVAGLSVASEARGVRHDLGDGGLGDVVVQAGDEGADGVVEFQPAPFSEEHEAGGGEALRVGGDAKAVARGKQLAGGEVGGACGVFEHELALMHDGKKTADLLWAAELIVDPGRDIGSGALQPVFHEIFPALWSNCENNACATSGDKISVPFYNDNGWIREADPRHSAEDRFLVLRVPSQGRS